MLDAKLWIALLCLCLTPALASAQFNPGPDVIVGELTGPGNYGSAGGYYAYSVGTTSCNKGDTPLLWIAGNNQHPVIAQHLYRLKDGRFEQIGISWLKHGFTALQGNTCGFGCSPNPGGSALGVGCSDPYGAGLNASQGNGPRSEINATTGVFPFPYNLNPPVTDTTSRRIRVAAADVDPAQNAGASYLIEGQYVAQDDSAAGNHHNNASYRQVSVNPGGFTLSFSGQTVREKAAIEGWADLDPTVTLTDLFVDGGRFILGTKVTDLANGFWDYEYALFNLNSDRSAGSFSVPTPAGVVIQNVEFHDVEYHSGEPYSGADWIASTASGQTSWSTETFANNQNANAIRWGTMYNFRFRASAAPVSVIATVGLFKPGTPDTAVVPTFAPIGGGGMTPPIMGLSCDVAQFDAALSWSNGAAYDSLLVFRDGQQIATLPGTATTYQESGLSVGSYDYIVNGVTNSVPSQGTACSIDVLPPQPVALLTCTVNGFQSNLSWVNADPYSAIEIRRNNALLATLAGTATSYDDLGLNVGTFTYRVTAVAGAILSTPVTCDIDVLPPPTFDFDLRAESQSVSFDPSSGQAAFTGALSLHEDPTNPGYPQDVSGFSVALTHDPAYLEAVDMTPGAALASMNGGSGPDFFASFLYPDGVTAGVVFSFMVTEVLQITSVTDVIEVSYETNATTLAGSVSPIVTDLVWADGVLGIPPVENTVVVGIASNSPTFIDGEITLVPAGSGDFVRGDANADGSVNLVDAVFTLTYLFSMGPAGCVKALDFNDDGSVNLPDPVNLLGYLFQSTPAPSAPFPNCGSDPTGDGLSCDLFLACP